MGSSTNNISTNNNNNNQPQQSTSTTSNVIGLDYYEGMNADEGDGRYVSPELLKQVLSETPHLIDTDLRASDIFSLGVSLAHLSGCDPRAARRGDLSSIGGN